ncbi:restriction endonuclease subunit S [Paenibacillus chungangensis]|uniref:Restriction endonuclease subunit S n=1 Tax=Paenibacillus chungangensis TaxID=696535 RepID=A0ABW3HKF1_9BACL
MHKEWATSKLGDICEFLDGRRKPVKKADREKMKGDIPYYGATGIVDWVDSYLFNESLVLLGEDGENLRSRVLPMAFKVEGKSWVNNHAHVIRPSSEIDIDFLVQYLNSLDYEPFITGSAQPKLNQNVCKKIPVNIPSFSEQLKIANILTSVDNAISKTEAIIEQTEKVKKGLMQQLLTKGIRHTKFKQTEIGEIPEEWDIGTLRDYSDHITKGATPTTYGFDWTDAGILFLRNECIKDTGLTLSGSSFISAEAHQAMKRSIVKHGDILITITGNLGQTCIFDSEHKEANINQHIARIRIVDDTLNPLFINYFLNSEPMRQMYGLIKTGLAYPQLSLKQVQEIRVPIPTKEEQLAIVEVLSRVDQKVSVESNKRQHLEKLKKGLMQSLLTGKVRVKVDDPEAVTT